MATIPQAFDLALLHHRAGRLAQAEQLYRRILAQQPNHADALHLLGVVALQTGRNDIAVDLIRRAMALSPDWPEAHGNLGNALQARGQLDQAIACHRRVVALRPDYPHAHYNLGNALKKHGQLEAAAACYRRAIALKSNYFEAHGNLGNVLKDQGHLKEAIAAFRQAIAIDPSYRIAHDNLVYDLHFHPDEDGRSIARELECWYRRHAEPHRGDVRHVGNGRDPDRRLRIGYVSPDLREHSVGRFLLPLLAHHDKSAVEIFAYADVSAPDAITEHLRAHAEVWQSVAGLSDAQLADLIRQDRIDILVDLTMHMAHNRLLVFARKPAPFRATYLAYCSTTGLPAIDYRLSDPYLDPPGEDESIYTERTMRLPETYWCYEPFIGPLDAGPLPALENRSITFGCLNNFCKISDPALAAWAKLLLTVPYSQLLLHAHEGSHRERVRQWLEREGVDPTRIEFVSLMPSETYFELYRRIDIALDTFPYGGGTTTCDALWMGVPVVSLVGRTAVGRGGLSILSNAGLPELVARSEEQYVRLAADLAGDLPRLTNLRRALRQRMEQSPLMDAPRFARGIEAAYRQMWRTWCATAHAAG